MTSRTSFVILSGFWAGIVVTQLLAGDPWFAIGAATLSVGCAYATRFASVRKRRAELTTTDRP